MKIIAIVILLAVLVGCGIPDYECRYSEDVDVIATCSEVGDE